MLVPALVGCFAQEVQDEARRRGKQRNNKLPVPHGYVEFFEQQWHRHGPPHRGSFVRHDVERVVGMSPNKRLCGLLGRYGRVCAEGAGHTFPWACAAV